MIRKPWVTVVPAAVSLVLAVVFASSAQEPKTTGEKLKEKVGGAVQTIKKGAVSAEEAIKEQYARAKGGVVKMGLEGRVYSRLHWDKALVGSKIDLAGAKEGVVTLTGTVSDERARARAVELTTTTVGVTEVIDRLTIQTTATTTEAVKP